MASNIGAMMPLRYPQVYITVGVQRVAAQEREHLLERQWRRIWRSLTSDRGVWAGARSARTADISAIGHPRIRLVYSLHNEALSQDCVFVLRLHQPAR